MCCSYTSFKYSAHLTPPNQDQYFIAHYSISTCVKTGTWNSTFDHEFSKCGVTFDFGMALSFMNNGVHGRGNEKDPKLEVYERKAGLGILQGSRILPFLLLVVFKYTPSCLPTTSPHNVFHKREAIAISKSLFSLSLSTYVPLTLLHVYTADYWSQDPMHAKHVLFHWAPSSAPTFIFNLLHNNPLKRWLRG